MKPAILACRPVDLDMSVEADRMTAAATFVYDGSIEGECQLCHRKVWIGPKGQEVMDTADIFCFMCAAIISGGAQNILNLGNPQTGPNRG